MTVKRILQVLKCNSRPKVIKRLERVFNSFIKLRDYDRPCISCGKWSNNNWQAGHYLTIGAYPELRFNEFNCHKQCVYCNIQLDGNHNNYRIGLIAKIDLSKVEWLENYKNLPKIHTCMLQDLIIEYKKKINVFISSKEYLYH